MADYNTFSAAVLDVIQRSSRSGSLSDLAVTGYIRQTLRECQTFKNAYYMRDFEEDVITATAIPHIFTRPAGWRKLHAVQYEDARGLNFVKGIMPGRAAQKRYPYNYYGGKDYYVFNNVQSNTLINIGYYKYFDILVYHKEETDRPATYDIATQLWTYKSATTDDAKTAARALVTNWMLFDGYETIIEGALAKIFKLGSDDARARTSYALFKQQQQAMLEEESTLGLGS